MPVRDKGRNTRAGAVLRLPSVRESSEEVLAHYAEPLLGELGRVTGSGAVAEMVRAGSEALRNVLHSRELCERLAVQADARAADAEAAAELEIAALHRALARDADARASVFPDGLSAALSPRSHAQASEVTRLLSAVEVGAPFGRGGYEPVGGRGQYPFAAAVGRNWRAYQAGGGNGGRAAAAACIPRAVPRGLRADRGAWTARTGQFSSSVRRWHACPRRPGDSGRAADHESGGKSPTPPSEHAMSWWESLVQVRRKDSKKGSGIFISETHILTAAHVVTDSHGLPLPPAHLTLDVRYRAALVVATGVAVLPSWTSQGTTTSDIALVRVDANAGLGVNSAFDVPPASASVMLEGVGFEAHNDTRLIMSGNVEHRLGALGESLLYSPDILPVGGMSGGPLCAGLATGVHVAGILIRTSGGGQSALIGLPVTLSVLAALRAQL